MNVVFSFSLIKRRDAILFEDLDLFLLKIAILIFLQSHIDIYLKEKNYLKCNIL